MSAAVEGSENELRQRDLGLTGSVTLHKSLYHHPSISTSVKIAVLIPALFLTLKDKSMSENRFQLFDIKARIPHHH